MKSVRKFPVFGFLLSLVSPVLQVFGALGFRSFAIGGLALLLSPAEYSHSDAQAAPLPASLNHPGYSEGLDQAMEVCTSLEQPHLRDRCRSEVSKARFFVPSAVSTCKKISFAPTVVECIEVISDQPYRESEVRSCAAEDVDRRKIDCLKSMRQPTYPGAPGSDSVSRSYVRQQVRSALDMMDLGNFYLSRQILTSLIWELDRNGNSNRGRPNRPEDDRSRSPQ